MNKLWDRVLPHAPRLKSAVINVHDIFLVESIQIVDAEGCPNVFDISLHAADKDIARSVMPEHNVHDMFVAKLKNRTVANAVNMLMLHGSGKTSNTSESIRADLKDDAPKSKTRLNVHLHRVKRSNVIDFELRRYGMNIVAHSQIHLSCIHKIIRRHDVSNVMGVGLWKFSPSRDHANRVFPVCECRADSFVCASCGRKYLLL